MLTFIFMVINNQRLYYRLHDFWGGKRYKTLQPPEQVIQTVNVTNLYIYPCAVLPWTALRVKSAHKAYMPV